MTTTAGGTTSTWLRTFHPASRAAVRLVCLPHAGGSASYWYGLSAALPDEVEVLAVQYPGRQDRRSEPLIEEITPLAEQIADALLPVAAEETPVALLGHSMGAVLAFEAARRLEAHGAGPVLLLASGRRAPSRYRHEDVHTRDDRGLIEELAALGGTDLRALTDPELLEMVLPPIRADYRAIETYRYEPGPPLGCPVHVLIGDADPKVDAAEAAAWREHTTGPFAVHTFPGGHFQLDSSRDAVVRLITGLLTPGD
jgi:surfactin synthase thioesterase subunit